MALKQQKPGAKEAKPGEFEQETPKRGLFDRSKLDRQLVEGTSKPPTFPLDNLGLAELLDLRAEIDKRLPARSLAEMDLEEEVLLQFARTKSLYDTVVEDENTPANQRAQVANSCTTILQQLMQMQTKLYGAERVKALEQVLVKVLKTLPEATQQEFFTRYERALEETGVKR
jgi:uncharacterized protein (UPF0147 family)